MKHRELEHGCDLQGPALVAVHRLTREPKDACELRLGESEPAARLSQRCRLQRRTFYRGNRILKNAALLALAGASCFACSDVPRFESPTSLPAPLAQEHERASGCTLRLSTAVKGFSAGGEAPRAAVAVLGGDCAGGTVLWSVVPVDAAAWTFSYPTLADLHAGNAWPLDQPGRYVYVQQLAFTGPQCMTASVVGVRNVRARVLLNGPPDPRCQ